MRIELYINQIYALSQHKSTNYNFTLLSLFLLSYCKFLDFLKKKQLHNLRISGRDKQLCIKWNRFLVATCNNGATLQCLIIARGREFALNEYANHHHPSSLMRPRLIHLTILVESGGGTHILRHTGCAALMGCFAKKSLNMGPISYKKIPKHGFVFPKIFRCEHPKIVKNGPIFREKSLKMSTFSCQNDP